MINYPKKIQAGIFELGTRIDKFVAGRLSIPRDKAKHLITKGVITLNGNKIKPSYSLKISDSISIGEVEKIISEKLPPAISTKSSYSIETSANDNTIPAEDGDLKIVYQSKSFAIIDKPAGLTVHPTPKRNTGTLANILLKKFPNISKVGDDPIRPGIVHRLDRDTSGLMIVPLTQEAFEHFKQQFKDRTIIKKYLAVSIGKVAKQKGVISYSIEQTNLPRVRLASGPNSKAALTYYQVLKYFKTKDIYATLLKVTPKTGRTHQIRVHLSQIGHPLLGDPLYGRRKINKELGLKQYFLHAYSLQFRSPDLGVDQIVTSSFSRHILNIKSAKAFQKIIISLKD